MTCRLQQVQKIKKYHPLLDSGLGDVFYDAWCFLRLQPKVVPYSIVAEEE